MPNARPHDNGTMATHQETGMLAKCFGEAASHCHIPDQHVRVAELVADVPEGDLRADDGRGMDDRTQRRRGDRKRQDR